MNKKTTRRKKTRTRRKKWEIEETEDLPIYKKIYPPLKDIFIYDENNEIQNKYFKSKSNLSKNKKRKSNLYDEQNLDEYFLNDLLKDPCPIPRQKVINTLSNFIQKSKLMSKLEKDYETTEKKEANQSLSSICAEKLKFEEYDRGEVIFKIGDSGENFYFILGGNVSVLKLKEIPNIQMNYLEYIKYCMYLVNQSEEYLLNEVLKANEEILSVSSVDDIKTINKIVFMRKLNQDISKTITTNKQLKSYFQINMQKYSEYDIRQDELDYLEQEKAKGKQVAVKEWEEYIIKRCSLLVSEEVFFQPYEKILTDSEPKKIICYSYEPFLYLGAGLFFGDTALDFQNNKRNATIRAEEKTYLAYLQREDYLNIISPMNKITRLKEIEFLYTQFFFMSINSHIFEKNFFHLFSHKEYNHGSILFSQGTIPHSVIFVKSGSISLELKCSIIDIRNLIQFLFDNIFLNPIFQRLSLAQKNRYMSIEKITIIKSYINDPTLMRLKTYNNEFINEMKAVRTYTITILTDNEIIGLEEIFLRMPYISKASVVNSKVDCYELSLVDLDKLLNCEKEVILAYTKYSMNKISTLIERLQNIKQNYINMSLAKYEGKLDQKKLRKNLTINANYEKNIKEEIKNSTKVQFNNNYENNSEKETFEENKMELTTVIDQKTASPIKTFMANVSPQNKLRIEEMKNIMTKLRKRNIRFNKDPFNYNYKRVLPKPTPINKMNNIKKNNMNEKNKLIDVSNKTSSVVYNQEDKLITKYLIDKLFVGKKDENNLTLKQIGNESEPNILHSLNIKTRNKIIKEIAENPTFNLSYIPLNLILQKEDKQAIKINKNNINELLTTNMNVNKFLSKQSPVYSNDNILILNNENNNEFESKSNKINNNAIINNKRNNFQKRLKALNKKVNLKNDNKEIKLIKVNNIIPKNILISGVIKDFYKDMKLNGYSSIIKNKKLNTIYLRKFNKKYNSAEKAYQNIKVKLLKNSNSLPKIS